MTLAREWIPSPNYSSRSGAVRLIVVHTAEGSTTYESLGNYFASSSAGVSSHVGIDDKRGKIGEYVKRPNKAWTQGDFNSQSVSVELCAFAKWSSSTWKSHDAMLWNVAEWIAEEAKHFGIPIRKLSPAQAQDGHTKGVCGHVDLGSAGGGHWDPGEGFPWELVLQRAAGGADQEADYMDPPAWLWDWLDWYLTTDRDPADKPKGVPSPVPDWAWEYEREVLHMLNRYGTTADERAWVEWYNAGKEGERPDVPDKVPERWWNDQRWHFETAGLGASSSSSRE